MSFEKHSQNWQSRAYTERETGRAGESHRIDLESEVFVILSAVATLVKDLCKKKKRNPMLNMEVLFLSNFHLSDGFIIFFFSLWLLKVPPICVHCVV